jgi:hypothetical protein
MRLVLALRNAYIMSWCKVQESIFIAGELKPHINKCIHIINIQLKYTLLYNLITTSMLGINSTLYSRHKWSLDLTILPAHSSISQETIFGDFREIHVAFFRLTACRIDASVMVDLRHHPQAPHRHHCPKYHPNRLHLGLRTEKPRVRITNRINENRSKVE